MRSRIFLLRPAWGLRTDGCMAARKSSKIAESDIVGLEYFDRLMPLLDRLHEVGTQRDRAGSRQRFFDNYCEYILLFLFPKRGKYGGGTLGPRSDGMLRIATNLLDVPAELIGFIYQRRWTIEIFFRFLKHILGCRRLLSTHPVGVEIQAYCAIIACLLIALRTGKQPTKRTDEMICFYFIGWADEEERWPIWPNRKIKTLESRTRFDPSDTRRLLLHADHHSHRVPDHSFPSIKAFTDPMSVILTSVSAKAIIVPNGIVRVFLVCMRAYRFGIVISGRDG